MANKPIVDTTREEVGGEVNIEHKGAIPPPLDPEDFAFRSMAGGIATVTPEQAFQNKLELERFMQEELEILVSEPQHPESGESWYVGLRVRDRAHYVFRGEPIKVRRMYVEVLARCRAASVSARGYKRADGEAINVVNKQTRALEYPFQVLHDPSGVKGHNWLRKILRDER